LFIKVNKTDVGKSADIELTGLILWVVVITLT
jgi:hypothetical protein